MLVQSFQQMKNWLQLLNKLWQRFQETWLGAWQKLQTRRQPQQYLKFDICRNYKCFLIFISQFIWDVLWSISVCLKINIRYICTYLQIFLTCRIIPKRWSCLEQNPELQKLLHIMQSQWFRKNRLFLLQACACIFRK